MIRSKLASELAAPSELRGQAVFFGKGQCSSCHPPPYYTDNLMHNLIDCANAYCTVGEIVATLKAVWGEFQQPVVF